MRRIVRYVFLVVVWMPHARAQPLTAGEQGRPVFAQRFAAEEYGLHNQNWSVAQDERGVIYVANTYGVLEFDGQQWRTIDVPNELVRALARGGDGRIYVGGVAEIGYLAPDSLGAMRYVSLRDDVPPGARSFADVWTVLTTSEGVHFQAFDRILRWDGERMAVWKTDDRFHKAFVVNDTYYVREEGVGLLRLEDGELRPVPGGDLFADERIDVMLPHERGEALIRTRTQGFLLLDGDRIRSFRTGADAYLNDKRVYHGAALYDGVYALTTFSGSVVLMGQDGRVRRILTVDAGLEPDDLVLYAMPDAQGGLWLALDDGVMRVDVPTALTVFGPESGLQGTAYTIRRYRGTLYVGTTQGLYELRPGRRLGDAASSVFEPPRFVPVAGVEEQCYDLLGTGAGLLAATNDGIYEVRGSQVRQVAEGVAFALAQEAEGGRVFVGMKEGIAVLDPVLSGWREAQRLDGIDEEIRSLTHGPDGSLWLGTLVYGVARVELFEDERMEVTWYGEAEGLPEGPALVSPSGSGAVLIHTLDGLYRLSPPSDGVRFVPDTALNEVIEADGSTHYAVTEPAKGIYWVWIDESGRIQKYKKDEQGGLVDETPPVLNFPGLQVRSVLDEQNGIVWIATDQGLFRYDGTVDKTYAEPYPALVRGVYDKEGDVVYGGAGGAPSAPRVTHDLNNLRFTFSAPSFNAPEATEYQYWLEGFDEGWSDWTDVTHKEYTNLPEADYRFHVRARNAQGVASEEGAFEFVVLPPWWRTWWAYAGYLLTAGLIVWGYGRFQLRRHAVELEREREVNRQLETANARLHEANERLQQADKLKDDFLANTSHELRTPLTSILGFASVLQEDLSGEALTYAEMIQQGGERLLGTVNSLLDMARLQADLMELDPVRLELVSEVRGIVERLEPEASAKGIYLSVAPRKREIEARLDRFCLERILSNVLENAIKFTEEGGVTVVLDAAGDEVTVTVRDTGIGIAAEYLPELFSEFQQVSSGYGRAYEGNGLGLAITQRLVSLLEGEIEVDSEVEQGTEVRIRLPRYDERKVGGVASPDNPSGGEKDLRVLLVESPERSDPRLRHLLSARCDIEQATWEEHGLSIAEGARYDLVFVDSQLPPNALGETALEHLRALPGHEAVPVVAVAAYSRPGDSELYRRLGFTAHIGKPITQHRVERVLDLAVAERVRARTPIGVPLHDPEQV